MKDASTHLKFFEENETNNTLDDSIEISNLTSDVHTIIYSNHVCMGCTVTIFDEEWGDNETYRIVGVDDANPSEGMISNESPIGNALLGAMIGQTVVADTRGGEMRLRVDAIT